MHSTEALEEGPSDCTICKLMKLKERRAVRKIPEPVVS